MGGKRVKSMFSLFKLKKKQKKKNKDKGKFPCLNFCIKLLCVISHALNLRSLNLTVCSLM